MLRNRARALLDVPLKGFEAHHIRDVTFREDTDTSRTGSGPANLATIRAAIITGIKDADHTTPAEALHIRGLDSAETGHPGKAGCHLCRSLRYFQHILFARFQ